MEPNDVQRAAFARLFRVATFMSNSVKSCDASIWTQAAMTAAQTAVTGLTTAIEQYEASKSVAHFEAAGDTAFDQFRNASISRFSTTAKDAEDAFFKFCEKAEAGIGSIEGVNRSIKEKEQEIIAARDKFQTQIAELGTQLESFKTQFEAQKVRVDELVASQSQAFQTAQTERTAGFTQEAETRKTTYTLESETRKTTFDQWAKDSDEKFEKLLTDSKSNAASNLAKMNEHLDRAKEILGIVAASVVGGHYKETAERDFKSANFYRWLALAFFVIMAVMIAYVVFSLNTDKFSWEMGLFRVGVGMALLIPAYYCAKESSKHREAERRNRRLQIELATIEPYLEKLDSPDEMKAILKEKANSYFMGQVPREPDDDVDSRLAAKEWKRREELILETLKAAGSVAKK